MDIAHVSAISLYVSDIARSREFYERVFQAPIIEIHENNIVVKLGNLMLNLLAVGLAYDQIDDDRGPIPLELNVWVDDVDEAYEELSARGVEFLAPPTDREWGMRNATFFDPDGHRWELAKAIG